MRLPERRVLLWCFAAVASCSGDDGPPGSQIVNPGEVARVTVTPPTLLLTPGGTGQLVAAAVDGNDAVLEGRPIAWSAANGSIATVSNNGLVTAVGPGLTTVTATSEGKSGQAQVTVSAGAPQGNVIDVIPSVTYQTITGWMGNAQNGWFECNPTSFAIYKNQVHDRLVNELGIDRVLVPLRSGLENTRDYHQEFVAGQIDRATYNAAWYVPVNDNADPFSTDLSKFHWTVLDGYFDNSVLPIRQRLQARGENLYVVLSYTDFVKGNNNRPFLQMKQPEEFAEYIVTAYKHLQSKYGFVPDAIELLLEPENTAYTATEMGRAMVAAVARLRAAGFNPHIIAPSTTSMANASVFYDQMLQVPGAQGLITELGYHRYIAVSPTALQAIGTRHLRDGVKTAMTEHIGSGFDDLYEDLTVAHASSWMQYALAFCGDSDNSASPGVYYQINQANPANPRINFTDYSKLFRQVFVYVRRGAVRLGAVSGNPGTLLPLAFRNTNGKQVVVIRAKSAASFSVRGLPAGRYGINYSTPGAEWNVNLPDQTIPGGGAIQAAIPRDGALTIYAR